MTEEETREIWYLNTCTTSSIVDDDAVNQTNGSRSMEEELQSFDDNQVK